jgi:hypothetical protein
MAVMGTEGMGMMLMDTTRIIPATAGTTDAITGVAMTTTMMMAVVEVAAKGAKNSPACRTSSGRNSVEFA